MEFEKNFQTKHSAADDSIANYLNFMIPVLKEGILVFPKTENIIMIFSQL